MLAANAAPSSGVIIPALIAGVVGIVTAITALLNTSTNAKAAVAVEQAKLASQQAESAKLGQAELRGRTEEQGRQIDKVAQAGGRFDEMAGAYQQLAERFVKITEDNTMLLDRATGEMAATRGELAACSAARAAQAQQLAVNGARMTALEDRVTVLTRIVHHEHPDLVLPERPAGDL